MGGSRCKCERMNPFYIGPYPDKSCGSCPYGIYSGYVPCGWTNRCKGMAERKECKTDLTKESKTDGKDSSKGNK